jgi:hypothetical protein
MSIRSDAYATCKSVWTSPFRDSLRSVIKKLQASESGYLAQGQHVQILGFLVVDQRKTNIEEKMQFLHIIPLEDEDRNLLSAAHRNIVQLNIRCIAPLATDLPQCVKAIDPYGKFKYEPPQTLGGDILSEEVLAKMAISFHEHPAIKIAIQSAKSSAVNMADEKYVEAVSVFYDTLIKAGAYDAPHDVVSIMVGQRKDSLQRIIARHITALTCIRASLSILDQLVYQAILSNKLPLLDQNNVSEIGQMSNNFVSNGFSLSYQPSEQLFRVNVHDVVLIKLETPGLPLGQLWHVEAIHSEFAQEFGSLNELTLREIDENLNPFGHLLEHM